MVKITINGKEYNVNAGDNLLEVIRANNIQIPSPCFKSERVKTGWCNLCLVKINGGDNLRLSCITKIEEGMTVNTETDSIVKSRKTNLESLFKEHYKEEQCNDCIWDGGCELHILAGEYEVL